MDEARDSGAHTGKTGRRDPGEAWTDLRVGVRVGPGGAQVGLGLFVLQEARGEPGAGPVPEAVEQSGRRLQEDQRMGVSGEGRN